MKNKILFILFLGISLNNLFGQCNQYKLVLISQKIKNYNTLLFENEQGVQLVVLSNIENELNDNSFLKLELKEKYSLQLEKFEMRFFADKFLINNSRIDSNTIYIDNSDYYVLSIENGMVLTRYEDGYLAFGNIFIAKNIRGLFIKKE